jgi:hypothetical protein
MIDFGLLPPEINSTRMYSGAGASPLLAAATAWTELAAGLTEAATGYAAAISGLAGVWRGPSAIAMTTAATRYQSWLTTTAAQADRTAAQAMAAAGAYETAFAATVPPALIATNRLQLAVAVSTNFLGVNSGLIAALEAHYAEMWAQDAAAMLGYQASSAQATSLQPFTPAPQVAAQVKPTPAASFTSPGTVQSILSGTGPLSNSTTLGQYLQAFMSSGPWQIPFEVLALLTPLWGTNSSARSAGCCETPPATQYATQPETSPGITPENTPPITAATAVGRSLGPLRVPPTWAARPNSMQTVPLESTPRVLAVEGPDAAIPALPFMPVAAGRPEAKAEAQPDYRIRAPFVMPRPPSGG